MTREQVEHELTFAGFVIISCPFKPDTKSVVKEIMQASHHITMITGDNPLTACHVAAQLKLIEKKSAYVLSHENDQWVWKSIVDERVQKPIGFALEKTKSKPASNKIEEAILMGGMNFFCLTGEVYCLAVDN